MVASNIVLGYQVIVCSAIFSQIWVEKEFGEGFTSHFLIGTVIKINNRSKKGPSYDVRFEYDNSIYTWKASELSNFETASFGFSNVDGKKGVVVKNGESSRNTTMAENSENLLNNEHTGAIVPFEGRICYSYVFWNLFTICEFFVLYIAERNNQVDIISSILWTMKKNLWTV
jgi:hypothetical protein